VCAEESFDEELDAVCIFFYDDLVAQLSTFHTLYRSVTDETRSVDCIKTPLLTLSAPQRTLLNEVCKLFLLLMILPTNATSERSFSALRRIKSYLKNTMSQERLNHLMILHYHQDITDSLDLKSIANDHITKNEARKNPFATFVLNHRTYTTLLCPCRNVLY
jgi:hypothetical protein